jgi:transcriptional regulator with XRE-family HTH domain
MRITSVPLAVAVGMNASEFRQQAGLTLDQVGRAARARGLKWTESRVADFEAGRVASPSINTLIALVLALNDAGCSEVTLPGLFKWINPLRINESLELDGGEVINLMAGEPVRRALDANDVVVPEMRWNRTTRERKLLRRFDADLGTHGRVSQRQGSADIRMSKALNVAPVVLARITAALWNSTFTEERDRRAGTGANAQSRGQVTRAIQAELEAKIKEALRGNH